MLFAQIIAQKRKKASKKYSNVKNCVKIYVCWHEDRSIRNVVRRRDVMELIKRKKHAQKNVHVTCEIILPLVL
ncbi:hypothetical protein COL05_02060 [Bacillus sp. AFS059628]|nr:hypothetical protein COL05_02060 [Bacillus sp. AFS059628]